MIQQLIAACQPATFDPDIPFMHRLSDHMQHCTTNRVTNLKLKLSTLEDSIVVMKVQVCIDSAIAAKTAILMVAVDFFTLRSLRPDAHNPQVSVRLTFVTPAAACMGGPAIHTWSR